MWTLTLQGAAPTINIASSDSFWCDKAAIDFFDLSTNNPTSWQWYFPGAIPDTSSMQNPTGIYYQAPGNYDVKLVACNAFGCDSITFSAFINEYLPPLPPVITQSYDTLWSSPAFSYQWFELNNPAIVISAAPYYVVSQPGSYFVIISDSLGCTTPSTTYVYTSISDMDAAANLFNAFYNNGVLNFHTSEFKSENVVIEIFDGLGKLIYLKKVFINESDLKIQVHLNNPSIYFLKISSAGRAATAKFVVN